jgi:fatty-acyl-CoA synthase
MSAETAGANFGIGPWIERRARVAPDHVAIIAGARALTYRELAARVRRLANGLRALGVNPSDRVAWIGPNHPAFLESLFAAGLIGAVLAPVNHRLEPEAIGWVLDDLQPAVVIEHQVIEPVAVPPSVRNRVVVGSVSDDALGFEALISESPDERIDQPVGADMLCMLPHTSGTTGRPKGVMLTHGNVTWNVVNFLASADFRGDDVTVAIAPFFRVGGTGVNVLPVIFMGGTVVVPEQPNPDEILRSIERHRVSVGFGNPDILDAMAHSELWSSVDLSSVRFIVTGGAPVPERLIRAYLARDVPLLQGYGLSEAAPLALLLDPESALRKIGSAGKPPLLVDVRIAGADGADVGPEETGELMVRGPNVMAGYWNYPEATRKVLTDDGWLRTGDAARMDAEGFVWIVDRVTDRFVADGHEVYPGDIERVLMEHPAIADAAVIAVHTEKRGEAPAALVVPADASTTPTAEELLALCAEHLAAYQVPVSVTFVDRLPRNSVGKLIRSQLRTLAAGAQPAP